MNMQANKPIHPLLWVTGIAVILFSAVGIAAIAGWIPTSLGRSNDNPALEKLSTNTPKPATPKTHTAPMQIATNSVPTSRCTECGVIESVQETEHSGEGSGIGAVGGAVVGGLLGNQVGAGRGKTAATVIGAVGGVVAGNEIEKMVKSTKTYAITVRLDDGSSRVINAAIAPIWRPGDKVKVVNNAIQSSS